MHKPRVSKHFGHYESKQSIQYTYIIRIWLKPESKILKGLPAFCVAQSAGLGFLDVVEVVDGAGSNSRQRRTSPEMRGEEGGGSPARQLVTRWGIWGMEWGAEMG